MLGTGARNGAIDSTQHTADNAQSTEIGWSRATVGAVVGIALARLAYLAWLCPYNLAEDEAHYWEWSRRLGWSYYSKGPGIALAIRAATELMGTSELAVRVPAVIAGAIAALAVAGLAADISGSRRIGFNACAAFLLAPMLLLVGLVSTIDGPYVACWAVACWAAWRALAREGTWAWLGLGAAVGAGFLFKYTILLLLPGLIGFATLQRSSLRPARAWPVCAAAAVALVAAGLAPVAVWNAAQGWPTVHHLLGHLGVAGGDLPMDVPGRLGGHANWSGHVLHPAEFIATQLGMVGPGLVLGLMGAMTVAKRPGRAEQRPGLNRGRAFLVWCAAPILVFYIAISFFTEAEGNWAMGGYVTLLALAGWVAADGMNEYRRRIAAWNAEQPGPDGKRPWRGILRRKPEVPSQMLWHAGIVYGLVSGILMLRIDWVAQAAQVIGLKAIPVGRFIGAADMSQHVAELADQLKQETGRPPFVIARHYGRASVLAFYLRDTPLHVYCSSSRMEGRPTQYDYWKDTDLDDPALLGRPAVMVGESELLWKDAFDVVRPVGTLRGDAKRGRPAFQGIGYKGMPPGDSGAPATRSQ